MASLVISVWLGAPTCYATDSASPYNETAVEERLDNIEETLAEMRGVIYEIKYGLFGARVIKTPITTEPATNETDDIILPIPDTVTNETDIVIVELEPVAQELNLRMDRIDAEFVSLQDDIEQAFNFIDDVLAENIEEVDEQFDEVNEQIENLENKVSRLQNTIVYVGIVTAVIVILSVVIVIKKGVIG